MARATDYTRSIYRDDIPVSEREKEVLDLVAKAMTNAEIAAHLFVTEKTVQHHVAALYRKSGISQRNRVKLSQWRPLDHDQ